MNDENEYSFIDEDEPKSAERVLAALAEAKMDQEPYWHTCDRIDAIIDESRTTFSSLGIGGHLSDNEFSLYWASLEIMKPAIYSKPPKPVVTPRFNDRNRSVSVASEMMERCVESSFDRDDLDEVMIQVRDDLITANRGVVRARYEADDEGKRVCIDHIDRRDFLHEPSRKWAEVSWVAFACYLTQAEFEKRFPKTDIEKVQFSVRRETDRMDITDTYAKARVWEVWDKNEKRVYWVTEGCDTFLDEEKSFLPLTRFFPCPKPAYGTLRRRSLVPIPDYVRYERTLEQINDITRRIHGMLDWIRVRGLIPAGGDVGSAVELALSQNDEDVMLIPIPAGGLTSGAGNFVQFLPLQEFAATVTGLIEARRELIGNYYELSGISDIMRGATDAGETLGAQQLKSQFGSVRIREKVMELQRVARDLARITAEIAAEKFDAETLQEMSQMRLPTSAELKKKMKELESAAKEDMKELDDKARVAIDEAQKSGKPIDPAQAAASFQAEQKAIVDKYTPLIAEIQNSVSIDQVMELLRDDKGRAFSIEIETDSTVMTDEIAEKSSRAEFLNAFGSASGAVQPLLMAGESGSKLAGGMLKFALAPFRAGRELEGMIDDFIQKAPEFLAAQAGNGTQDKTAQALAEAQMKLADAELQKAQAAIAKVQADTAKSQQDLQLKAAQAQAEANEAEKKFALELEQTRSNIAETNARIEKIMAEIQKYSIDARNQSRQADREDVKTVAGLEKQKYDQRASTEQRMYDQLKGISERQTELQEQPDPSNMNGADEWQSR